MDYWGLATIKPLCERVAVQNLSAQSFCFYNPQIEERKIKRGKVSFEPVQLFPGYLFVLLDDAWKRITGTKGIGSLMMNGELPSRMRETEIQNIRSMEVDGFVLLPSKQDRKKKFFQGQTVEITSGPLINKIGIYAGDRKGDRVKVLYQMLGRSCNTYVRESDLVAA